MFIHPQEFELPPRALTPKESKEIMLLELWGLGISIAVLAACMFLGNSVGTKKNQLLPETARQVQGILRSR